MSSRARLARLFLASAALAAAAAAPARAFEFFDGRLALHGYYENQIRTIARDFETSDDFDLTQLAHVLNLEVEGNIAPDGFGPFDLVSAFGRVEVRYDCVWTRACGLFSSADAYGDRVGKLPKRLFDGRRAGLVGNVPNFEQVVTDAAGNPVLDAQGDPVTRAAPDLRGYRGQQPIVAGIKGPYGVQDFVDPRDGQRRARRQYLYNESGRNKAGIFEVEPGTSVYGERRAFSFDRMPGIFTLFRASGFDRVVGTTDDPARFVFDDLLQGTRCRFSTRKQRGSEGGIESLPLGPHDPRCFVDPIAKLDDKPNPFRGRYAFYNRRVLDPTDPAMAEGEFFDAPDPEFPLRNLFGNESFQRDGNLVSTQRGDSNPMLTQPTVVDDGSQFFDSGSGTIRGGDLPYRPAPLFRFDSDVGVDPGGDGMYGTGDDSSVRYSRDQARGLWYPNAGLARELRKGHIDRFGGNFRQEELEWNRGASQQDEKELRELYVDLEMLDSRLWIRAGKQSIVWGKTELFRNQDQFNPQDFALSSLPTLEESRINLWALRGVWSFYDVGPLEDVRLELAANFDDFEPPDFGRCGEPYAVSLICSAYFGLMAHGLFGIGLAGVRTPEDPWDDIKGLEVGGRIEWRWSRFSFALTDFYGYQDFPYLERIFTYERNVDPETGRPRETNLRGPCSNPADPTQPPTDPDCLLPREALSLHSVNQTLFAVACASTIGITDNTPDEGCGSITFNSHKDYFGQGFGQDQIAQGLVGTQSYSAIVTNLHVGNRLAYIVAAPAAPGGVTVRVAPPSQYRFLFPFVPLNNDPCDGLLSDCATPDNGPGGINEPTGFGAGVFESVNEVLTQQQKALLGCGEFYDTNCEIDGFDLLNAEASVLAQSFVGIEGTSGTWNAFDPLVPQPGTSGAPGIPVGTRYQGGQVWMVPGARGPQFDAASLDFVDRGDYDPNVDGCVDPSVPGCQAAQLLTHPLAGRRPGPDGIFDFGRPLGGPNDDFFDCDDDGDGDGASYCQVFRSEMAALSFDTMMILAGFSLPPRDNNPATSPTPVEALQLADVDEILSDKGPDGAQGTADDDVSAPFRVDGCSFAKPQFCRTFSAFMAGLQVQRNTRLAGGNGQYGRRDFGWHVGSPILIRWEKSNVLGFSTDFAEDYTKSNWSMELTWVAGNQFQDADKFDGVTDVDLYNMTISVDRPTFVNFLNPNRTFFINSQWFIQYVDGYRRSFPSSGPWNVLATLAVTTGYFQDRLLPTMIFVYDKRSNSGAFLPQIAYRFNENFSATFGVSVFAGRNEFKPMSVSPIASGNRVGSHAYSDSVVNGLSAVRERDEIYLRIKYTF